MFLLYMIAYFRTIYFLLEYVQNRYFIVSPTFNVAYLTIKVKPFTWTAMYYRVLMTSWLPPFLSRPIADVLALFRANRMNGRFIRHVLP
jgi:hypothetical protein